MKINLYYWLAGLACFAGIALLAYRISAPRLSDGVAAARGARSAELQIRAFNARIEELSQVDEALYLYREIDPLTPPGLESLRAIAVDATGRLYAGGGRQLVIWSSRDGEIRRMTLPADVTCLAVDGRQRLYVGLGNAVQAYDVEGQWLFTFDGIDETAIVTSIAANEEAVFVADAQSRRVLHFSPDGELMQVIDGKEGDPEATGFVIPSPYFDLVLGQGSTLWIVNPGRHQLEEYSFDGHRIQTWARDAGAGLEDFCGCCNPSHLARLSDGSIVTSEKGLSRVKLYTRRGGFMGVVAAPRDFDSNQLSLDLAVDPNDRILVADPSRLQVRVFERL